MPVKNNGPGIRVPKSIAKYPARAEIDLRSIMKRRLEEIRKIIKDEMPKLMAIAMEQQPTENPYSRMDGNDDELVRRLKTCFKIIQERIEKSRENDPLEKSIRKCADYTNERELSDWKRSVRSALGVSIVEDYFVGTRYDKMLAEWVRQNAEHITSMEAEYIAELEKIIIDGFTTGKSAQSISKKLQSCLDISKSKAKNLARDQIGTLSSQLTRVRHEAAGVHEYDWDTSGDGRVRPCHAELNGKRFRYDDPPPMWYMTKHGKKYSGRRCNPGEDYGCRCIARPVFDFEKIDSAAFKEK